MADETDTYEINSEDTTMPAVSFRHQGAVILSECGRYTARTELEERRRSRTAIRKDGKLFVDFSVHHQFTPGYGDAFTTEVTHVICALIWSATRRDGYPNAWGTDG